MSDSPHMSSCNKTNYPVSAVDSFSQDGKIPRVPLALTQNTDTYILQTLKAKQIKEAALFYKAYLAISWEL